MSDKPKFTPGPWRINSRRELRLKRDGDWATDIFTGKGEALECVAVAVQASTRDAVTAQSNARLIAAAPELYEIAQKYLDSLGRRKPTFESIEEFKAVNALLKKIGGEA